MSRASQSSGIRPVQVKTTYQTAGRAQPALGASNVMASVVAMGVNNGNVQTALGIRTAVDASAD